MGEKAKRLSPLSPFPSHYSPPRSRSTLVPIIPLPRFSLVSRDLDLGKPVEEAGCCTVFIYFGENDSDGPSGLSLLCQTYSIGTYSPSPAVYLEVEKLQFFALLRKMEGPFILITRIKSKLS